MLIVLCTQPSPIDESFSILCIILLIYVNHFCSGVQVVNISDRLTNGDLEPLSSISWILSELFKSSPSF